MERTAGFRRRGIVEGFFGPLWSMAHRRRLFAFGAARGMNTYLYAPKDDPYHRKRWRLPYPAAHWRDMARLIRAAQKHRIDFIYGFHPGEGLCFSDPKSVQVLLRKARRFYDAGVHTFAVLFDDIPSRLTHARDRRSFKNSLACAEATWIAEIEARQPSSWKNVEWWICPSYYSEDALLERVFGRFEPFFLETLAEHLPVSTACFWTGDRVVSRAITSRHAQKIVRRIGGRPLLLWDNYPVNDLSMAGELHIGPLQGRDPKLPDVVYGYLNNPLLQEELSFLPLATCFDYAAAPGAYGAEKSWARAVKKLYGANALPHWRTLRRFTEIGRAGERATRGPALRRERRRFAAALDYFDAHRKQKWSRELAPWTAELRRMVSGSD